MERRFFLKYLAASVAATSLYKVPQLHAQTVSSQNSMLSLQLNLSGAGRLGFYIDYSERETAGGHTFYVTRTHGSQGAVSVTYATEGDAHTSVSGSISWADGDMSIKSFTVEVTVTDLNTHQNTLGLGEHRIWALLSNPTNSGVLHFGTEYTRAYGVIDNNVVSSDANAVFYDSAAAGGGDGASTTPYNNIYTALANIGSKRYLYGKGTTIPDSTNSINPNGGGGFVDCMILPVGRATETDRMFIRNWGADTWTVKGGAATNKIGFYSDGGANYNVSNYIAFKGIAFLDLNASGSTFAEGGGIGYFKSPSAGVNVEKCTFTNIDGSTNTSGFNAYNMNGSKIWKCTADTIKVNGSIAHQNSGGVMLTYDGKNISVQRSESSNSAHLVYHKRVGTAFDVTTSVRFCISTGNPYGVHYGRSGSSGVPHSYSIVQCNIIKTGNGFGIYHEPGSRGQNGSFNATKHWWCNNVFDSKSNGENGPIQFRQAYSAIIFNNIYFNSRKLWRETQDSSAFGAVMEYADHELHFGTTSTQVYEYQVIDYPTATALQAVKPGFAVNDVIADPLFTNPAINDYTLQAGSPALTGGVSGTQQGVYLLGIEKIGVNDLNNNAPPEKMVAPEITILDS
jgi:hypothetical protein